MGVGKAVRVVARTSRRVSHTAPAVHTVTHTVSGVSHLPSAVGLVSSAVAPASAAASSTSATAAAAAARQAAVAKARQHRAKQQSKQIDKHRKDLQRNDVSKIRQKFTAKPVRGATKATVSRQRKLFPQTVPASHARLNPTASKVPEQKAAPKQPAQAPKRAGLIDKLDQPFSPSEQVTPKQAALLAEAVGLPGKTYAQIAKGESSLRPGAKSSDGGYGLWQMTPRVQSPQTVAKWNQIAKKHPGGYMNPVANAKMAKYLAAGGTGVSNYYGTGFVTNPDAHLKGGPQRARKILGKPGKVTSIKKLPGGWDGSKKAVLSKLPKSIRPEGRGDKRTPAYNAEVGGSPTSDHLTTNKAAYAADIPVDLKVYHRLQKELGLPQTATGEQTITKGGYRYQLIYGAQYGHGDHIHLGAEWTGAADSVPGGSTSGVATAMAGRGAVSPSAATAGTSVGKATSQTEAARTRAKTSSAKKRGKLISSYISKPGQASTSTTVPLVSAKNFAGKTAVRRRTPLGL